MSFPFLNFHLFCSCFAFSMTSSKDCFVCRSASVKSSILWKFSLANALRWLCSRNCLSEWRSSLNIICRGTRRPELLNDCLPVRWAFIISTSGIPTRAHTFFKIWNTFSFGFSWRFSTLRLFSLKNRSSMLQCSLAFCRSVSALYKSSSTCVVLLHTAFISSPRACMLFLFVATSLLVFDTLSSHWAIRVITFWHCVLTWLILVLCVVYVLTWLILVLCAVCVTYCIVCLKI